MEEYKISITLASKLASIVVHTDEMLNPSSGHAFDKIALDSLLKDLEVKEWVESLGALAPKRRNK